MLKPPRRGMILDWGCGTCLALPSFQREDVSYIGLDFSLPMLQRARDRSASPVVLGDCTKLPFRGGAFDGVMGATVIQNIPSKEKAIEEISRTLKKGGRSVLSYPDRADVTLPDFSRYGLRVLMTTGIHEDRAILYDEQHIF